MLIDIPVYITVEEDSFKHAEDLVSTIMQTALYQYDIAGWRFIPDEAFHFVVK